MNTRQLPQPCLCTNPHSPAQGAPLPCTRDTPAPAPMSGAHPFSSTFRIQPLPPGHSWQLVLPIPHQCLPRTLLAPVAVVDAPLGSGVIPNANHQYVPSCPPSLSLCSPSGQNSPIYCPDLLPRFPLGPCPIRHPPIRAPRGFQAGSLPPHAPASLAFPSLCGGPHLPDLAECPGQGQDLFSVTRTVSCDSDLSGELQIHPGHLPGPSQSPHAQSALCTHPATTLLPADLPRQNLQSLALVPLTANL